MTRFICHDSAIGTLINRPAKALDVFRPMMLSDRETMCVMLLDAARKVITAYVAGIGTLTSVSVDTREIFRPAVAFDAAYMLIAHNHPLGDPTPSQQDIETTKLIKAGCLLLGFPLIDHLVMTNSERFSSVLDVMENGEL